MTIKLTDNPGGHYPYNDVLTNLNRTIAKGLTHQQPRALSARNMTQRPSSDENDTKHNSGKKHDF